MCNPANFITVNQTSLADPALTNEDEYFEDEEEYDEYNEFADGHMDRLIDQYLDRLEEQAWGEEEYILEGLYLAVASGEGLDEAINAARAFGMSEEAIDEEVSKLRRDKEEDPDYYE